jgi:ABC-type transport system involved in multi-copper enzyme maturation permease subunit
MSIDPIRYRPWSGERTQYFERIFVVSKTFFRHSLRSKWLLALMILGIFLVVSVSLIIYVILPHSALEPDAMAELMGNELFLIIAILLAAMICSDTISEDLRSNSFVLYFSRAIRAEGYLAGKMGGAALTLSLFTFFPAVVMALIIMATQSGGDYGSSLVVFGSTVLAGLVTTLYFLPFGLLISSLTTRKSYASVATFMAVFAMTIVGGIFSAFDRAWELLNPTVVLSHFYDFVLGIGLEDHVNGALLAAIFLSFFLAPLVLVWYRIRQRAVGK